MHLHELEVAHWGMHMATTHNYVSIVYNKMRKKKQLVKIDKIE